MHLYLAVNVQYLNLCRWPLSCPGSLFSRAERRSNKVGFMPLQQEAQKEPMVPRACQQGLCNYSHHQEETEVCTAANFTWDTVQHIKDNNAHSKLFSKDFITTEPVILNVVALGVTKGRFRWPVPPEALSLDKPEIKAVLSLHVSAVSIISLSSSCLILHIYVWLFHLNPTPHKHECYAEWILWCSLFLRRTSVS